MAATCLDSSAIVKLVVEGPGSAALRGTYDDDAAGVARRPRITRRIHLATAGQLGQDLGHVVTYDERMADSPRQLSMKAASPA